MLLRWELGQRYCLVHVHQDLFGDWLVTRAWGVTNSQYGGLKHIFVNSAEEAAVLVDDIRHIHESRGYRKVFEVRHPEEIPLAFQQIMKGELVL